MSTTIRLEDARGCWTFHTVSMLDRFADNGTFTRGGASWKSIRFLPTAERDPLFGFRVFRASTPAIGPAGAAFSPLYLPDGWTAPVGAAR